MSVRRLTNIVYEREALLSIRTVHACEIVGIRRHLDILHQHGILSDPVLSNICRRKQQRHKQRRGKRAGINAWLRANPTTPAVPTVLLSNVRSHENKLDELRLLRESRWLWRDCCIFIFTESWLQDNISDEAVQLGGATVFRANRDAVTSSKSRGGGVCIYVNKDWCTNAVSVAKYC